jgi:hypothetical protein
MFRGRSAPSSAHVKKKKQKKKKKTNKKTKQMQYMSDLPFWK